MVAFKEFPKIARYNREIIVTEKIDGTNAAVVVTDLGSFIGVIGDPADAVVATVSAQSRNRTLTPGKETDNFGFAAWVEKNAEALKLLGPGYHYGEWFGKGIQRGYGLDRPTEVCEVGVCSSDQGSRRFILFDVKRWLFDDTQREILQKVRALVPDLDVVPVLYRGPRIVSGGDPVSNAVEFLRVNGSVAVPGFSKPEGVVVLHTASRQLYKVTLEGDESYKSAA